MTGDLLNLDLGPPLIQPEIPAATAANSGMSGIPMVPSGGSLMDEGVDSLVCISIVCVMCYITW